MTDLAVLSTIPISSLNFDFELITFEFKTCDLLPFLPLETTLPFFED